VLDRLITFALQQRVFVLVGTAALVFFGWNAVSNLPIEAFPDVQDVQVQIVTQVPGQAPEEVERAVTLPIEREMSGVPRMTNLRSVSITGLSVVTLTFADQTDDYFARQQVLERLQTVNLPQNVQPALAPLTTAVGEIFRYMLDAPADMPPNEVRAIQDWVIRPALRIVPGIADVVSFGGTIKEYQVRLSPYLMKKFAVTIDQIAAAIGNNSANAGGGLLRRGEESLVIRGIGLFRSLDDIGRVVIASRGGRPILASDVAGEVAIGSRPRSGVVAFNDRDAVVEGIVLMTKGGNAAKVVAKSGPSCEKFKSKDWMDGDYYVFVTGPDDKLVCHPNASMVGKANADIVDANGKKVGLDLIAAAKKKGGGWVDYVWPRPGQTTPVAKSSYATQVKGPDGKWYVVGAGGYELK